MVRFPAESLEGEASWSDFGATRRDDSGDRRGALVRLGSARRLAVACRCFLDGVSPAASDMRPTALGVGVAGGGAAVGLLRRFCGVVGVASGSEVDLSLLVFRLRDRLGGGGMETIASPVPFASAFKRADLRAVIVTVAAEGRC